MKEKSRSFISVLIDLDEAKDSTSFESELAMFKAVIMFMCLSQKDPIDYLTFVIKEAKMGDQNQRSQLPVNLNKLMGW